MKRMVILLTTFSALLCAYVEGGETRAPTVICRRASQPPVIDGYISEDVWNEAETLVDFLKHRTDAPSSCPSAAVILYDNDALYLGMIMSKNIGQEINVKLWTGDCVELFVDPGLSREDCFQLAGSLEKTFSAAYPGGGSDFDWTSGMKFAARKLASGWALEMSIPFESLGGAPSSGDIWGVNICRTDPQNGRMTLAPLKGAPFRSPQLFCEMTFTDEKRGTTKRSDNKIAAGCGDVLAKLKDEILAMSDDNAAKAILKDRVGEIEKISQAVERDAREHPVVADVYKQWANSNMLHILENELRWRFMTGKILFYEE